MQSSGSWGSKGIVAMFIFQRGKEALRDKFFKENFDDLSDGVYKQFKNKMRGRYKRFLRDDHPSKITPIKH